MIIRIYSIYNGSTITYDAMGNPMSHLGKKFAWEERQLTLVTDSTHSYSYSYNEDGLRLHKVVDGNDTEYYYNGSVLMYKITGSGSTAIKRDSNMMRQGNFCYAKQASELKKPSSTLDIFS